MIFHPLVHFSKGCNVQDRTKQKPGASVSHMGAGMQAHGSSFAAFRRHTISRQALTCCTAPASFLFQLNPFDILSLNCRRYFKNTDYLFEKNRPSGTLLSADLLPSQQRASPKPGARYPSQVSHAGGRGQVIELSSAVSQDKLAESWISSRKARISVGIPTQDAGTSSGSLTCCRRHFHLNENGD